MPVQVGKKKRGFLTYSRDLQAAATVLSRQIDRGEPKKVYPAVVPDNPVQFVDVEDEYDHRFLIQTSKRRLLNFATRCRIIEERFGEYGGQFTYPLMGVCAIARKLRLSDKVVGYHIKVYVKNKGKNTCNISKTL